MRRGCHNTARDWQSVVTVAYRYLDRKVGIMRVWLDDERNMPQGYDVHVKTASEAIKLIKTGQVTAISLDHDLGAEENGTGYDVAKYILEQAFLDTIPRIRCKLHTMNPVGRENMAAALRQAMECGAK